MKTRATAGLLAILLIAVCESRGDDRQPPAVDYPDHADLSRYRDDRGEWQPIASPDDWNVRRAHIVAGVERVMGTFPRDRVRLPLDVRVQEESRVGEIVRRRIDFRSDDATRVPAWVLIPAARQQDQKLPAVLCLHQTTTFGKDEPIGLRGDADLKYALELAQRGYVAIAPDYPSFGEYEFDFETSEYPSGSMKAVWDNSRAIDVLTAMPEVDAERIGVIGHSLGGHSAIFTALFEPRLKAIVSSCGFTALARDDVPSWTGPRYMPRIATEFGNEAGRIPFDFHELVAAMAPRPFLACAAEQDDDFDAAGVREVMAAARTIYSLHDAADQLEAIYPPAPHSFPAAARKAAYAFLDRRLKPRSSEPATN